MKVAGRQISVLVAASSFAIIALLGAFVGYFSQDPLKKGAGVKPALSTTINVDGPDAQRITLTSHEGTSTTWGAFPGGTGWSSLATRFARKFVRSAS